MSRLKAFLVHSQGNPFLGVGGGVGFLVHSQGNSWGGIRGWLWVTVLKRNKHLCSQVHREQEASCSYDRWSRNKEAETVFESTSLESALSVLGTRGSVSEIQSSNILEGSLTLLHPQQFAKNTISENFMLCNT